VAGILGEPEPHEVDLVAPDPVKEPEARPAKKRKLSRVSSKIKGVTGRTFYLHDTLFAMISGKAITRGETVSEFASWVFEGHFGVEISGPRKRKASGAGESSEAA
jgi:hypothetical protein